MNLEGNTVLITGGASGIGLALAERFQRAGSTVLAVGRREDKLQEARQQLPGLLTRVCDVAEAGERVALVEWISRELPQLNVLVNNAGIQHRFQLTEDEDWETRRQELVINVEAPIHLTTLLLPHLRQQPRPAIINVTSGLAFAPMAQAPIYSATKAALHSFTLSLRHQLAATPIQVLEIVPPAVNTDLGGAGLHTWGVPVNDFADSVMQRLAAGEQEVGYGTSEEIRRASREQIDARFQLLNNR
ncbi:SDR family NAD(P)-dependent oxidoreductase [Hymenobacter sp. 5516J-16]|uniref:SDR family oxidoreductase n=1 Tax=Hymenobacter sp. 5516J-16 TaxID=2932253 RepID=UPI001FD4077B|nr:SDR family NAD(P)-dependent oxidoreductase [Hymenobacter sp. 5516J-16]UOQ76696.1 SDR family NAD(P)-dependent oxidoreductase [Hymenobacter sp. 5516J-16]